MDDPTGPFHGKAVYFDQRTGRDALYEVRTARPVGKVKVRMAAMSGFVVEILDVSPARTSGRTAARTGPHAGGNAWGECEVKFTPRTHFLMRFHNEASNWLFIDRVMLE